MPDGVAEHHHTGLQVVALPGVKEAVYRSQGKDVADIAGGSLFAAVIRVRARDAGGEQAEQEEAGGEPGSATRSPPLAGLDRSHGLGFRENGRQGVPRRPQLGIVLGLRAKCKCRSSSAARRGSIQVHGFGRQGPASLEGRGAVGRT